MIMSYSTISCAIYFKWAFIDMESHLENKVDLWLKEQSLKLSSWQEIQASKSFLEKANIQTLVSDNNTRAAGFLGKTLK